MEHQKPKWLKRLERESWQAELIISGAAIFGALQLPDLLSKGENYALLNMDDDTLFNLSLVNSYFSLVVYCLIATFIFHFVLRTLWIGMIGLNSVFPGGFKANKRFSEDLQGKIKAAYGDVDGYIQRLDRFASGVFGVGFTAVFVFGNFGLIGLVAVFLIRWVKGMDSQAGAWVSIVVMVILVAILVAGTGQSILNMKWFRDKEWVKRIHFPITKIMYRIFYPLNSRYLVTSLNLISSNSADKKGYWGYLVATGLLIGVLGAIIGTSNPKLPYFYKHYFHRIGADSLGMISAQYADEEHEGLLHRPLLPSKQMNVENSLTFWFPLPQRTFVKLLDQCSDNSVDDALSGQAFRQAVWLRNVRCAREYIAVSVNGQNMRADDIRREWIINETGTQYGLRYLILDPPLKRGSNLLTVTSQYLNEDGEPKIDYVPFYAE